MPSRPILVTGGSGLVGLHVARAFAETGNTVVAMSAHGEPPHSQNVVGDAAGRVQFVAGDVVDFQSVLEIVKDADIEGIVHTAARTAAAYVEHDPLASFSVNVLGTENIVEVARLQSLRRVVFISSSAVYGRRTDNEPIGEDEENPQDLYAEQKLIAERLGIRYADRFGTDFIAVRIASVYGPNKGANPFMGLVGFPLVDYLCRAALSGDAVAVPADPRHTRSYTYVKDVALGIRLAYYAEKLTHRVFNLGVTNSYSLVELVEILRSLVPGAKVVSEFVPEAADATMAGTNRGPFDISRAVRELGFSPQYTLVDGLRDYLKYLNVHECGGARQLL